MNDIPATPPPPAARATQSTQTLQNLPVETAPTQTEGQTVEGKIANINTQTGQVQVSTAEGDIIIYIKTPPPVDTAVLVDVYRAKTELQANIKIIQQQDIQAQQTMQVVESAPVAPPLLQPGDIVTAIFMPLETTAAPTLPAPEVIAQNIIAQLPALNITAEQLPFTLPVSNDVIQNLLQAQNPLETFQQLPDDTRQSLVHFLNQPEILNTIQNLLPKIQIQSPANTPVTDILATLPQTVARPLSTATSQDTAPVPRLIPETLTPLIQTLSGQINTINPPTEQQLPPSLLPLPDNIQAFKIISIDTTPSVQSDTPAVQQGIVDIVTDKGIPIVKTDAGHFILKSPATLPEGTIITFEATPATAQEILSGLAPLQAKDQSGFSPFSSKTWPALQEAIQIIQQDATMASTLQNIKQTIPTATAQFTPTAMLFLAVLQLRNVENWLGKTTLEALQNTLLTEKLSGDFTRISDQARETLPNGWKSISMPLLHDEQINMLHFYVRHQQEERQEGEEDSGKSTRFILDVSLSRMGDIQLDGYIRDKKFDLVLRTEQQLPFSMRQDIMQRYAAGLEQTNMQGGIHFQVKKDHWVTIAPETKTETVV